MTRPFAAHGKTARPAGAPRAAPAPRRPRHADDLLDLLTRAAAASLPPAAAGRLVDWVTAELAAGAALPRQGRGLALRRIAGACAVDAQVLRAALPRLRPALLALAQAMPPHPRPAPRKGRRPTPRPSSAAPRPGPARVRPQASLPPASGFAGALARHMRRWNETAADLARALAAQGLALPPRRIRKWREGAARPKGAASLRAVALIEARYGIAPGDLAGRIAPPARRPPATPSPGWHLPKDFAARPPAEQAEILAWVRRTFRHGTDYGRFVARATREPFRLSIATAHGAAVARATRTGAARRRPPRLAPAEPLASELAALMAFKTADLAPPGRLRQGVWGPHAAALWSHHLGLMFGAMAAPADGPVAGLGARLEDLTLGLLVLPAAWDWYLGWRRTRRGFLNPWETRMLKQAVSLSNPETGWLTQSPQLAHALRPIPGLVTEAEVDRARADWEGACRELHRFARMRAQEVARLALVHRDPFQPILPVLEAASPLTEYLKIADEIARHAATVAHHPLRCAEARRDWLMVRLGLHLGFRGRNLRELLVCPPGQAPRRERELAILRRAELRWDPIARRWEVFAPAAAFKNAGSSFFGGAPFRLPLPDRGGLYAAIDDWLARHRPCLLAGAPDPGVFFVRHVRAPGDPPELDRYRFHEAWRRITERHGVHNPWTGRGAIAGLLPHGPHALRAVLATHVLKVTGSAEQAAYAIQDTPGTIQRHYARFLPSDKAAIAAQVLDAVWRQDLAPRAGPAPEPSPVAPP